MTGEPLLPFIDNPHAPEVFSTGVTGFLLANGNVHLTFEAIRIDHSTNPGPANRVVMARLVMPLEATQRLVIGLHDYLSKQGADPTAAMKGGGTAQ